MAQESGTRPSTFHLIGRALREASSLFTTEVALARLEMSEKLTLALASVVSLIVAAIFVIVALIFLLQGLVAFMVAQGFASFAASFTVGGTIAFAALIAVIVAMRNLTAAKLKPGRTLGQIDDAKEFLRGRK